MDLYAELAATRTLKLILSICVDLIDLWKSGSEINFLTWAPTGEQA